MKKGLRDDRPRAGEELEGLVVAPGEREAMVETARGVVRVRGVVPGDRVRVRLMHAGANALWGELAAVLAPSPDRVRPRCGLVATCGGCPWQAIAPEAQREERRRALAEVLAPVLDGLAIAPFASPPEPYGFRNKLLLAAGGRTGALTFGLYAPRSRSLVPATECPVHDPIGARVIAEVTRVLDAARLPPRDDAGGRGALRFVLLRVAPGTGQVGVTLVVHPWPLRDGPALGAQLLAIDGVVSVVANHNPTTGAVALGDESVLLAGRARLAATVGGVPYTLSPTAFFQTNTAALPLLVQAVADALPERMTHLLDLYAGVGLFALAFAPRAARVSAIDTSPASVADLAAGAAAAGHRHVYGITGDAGNVWPGGPPPDAVIVDPPRAGLPPRLVARLVAAPHPARLVYVSCGPRALARDLAALVEGGYRIRSVQPVDLFPHTPHVETVVGLEG